MSMPSRDAISRSEAVVVVRLLSRDELEDDAGGLLDAVGAHAHLFAHRETKGDEGRRWKTKGDEGRRGDDEGTMVMAAAPSTPSAHTRTCGASSPIASSERRSYSCRDARSSSRPAQPRSARDRPEVPPRSAEVALAGLTRRTRLGRIFATSDSRGVSTAECSTMTRPSAAACRALVTARSVDDAETSLPACTWGDEGR